MKSYLTSSRWLLLLAMGLFLFGSSGSLFAQENQSKQAILEAMHGPTVEVPQSDGRAVGDNCTTPIVVNIPADLPYADLGNYTCGRGNTYSNSDLGLYDGGDDIIYELNVTVETEVTITLDPKTTSYAGLGLFTACPTVTGNSVATQTGSAASPKVITETLMPGTYYVMADTWPSPNCIPVLDLTIELPPPPPANDLCADAEAIACGDMAMGSTLLATNTGAPTGCLGVLNTGPGVWYSFTGNGLPATLSLAGSSFDTKLGVFSGTCGALVCEAYDDDGGPGVTSELSFQTTNAVDYLIYVTGFGTGSGDYTLSLSCVAPGIEIVNANLDMGDRPIGAWMKPAAFEIVNNPGAGDFEITEADIDDNFGGYLQVVTPELPYTLASGETTMDFGVTNGEAPVADGPFSGSFAMFFGSRAVLTADYSGNAYTPVAGDVWEMAFDIAGVTFPDNVAMGSFVDNYDLPGATADGWDVVYKIDVDAGDIIVDASLAGTDAKMALYPANFGDLGGPDMDNALFSATTTATGLELFEGVYYLVVSTTGPDYTLDVNGMIMPAPDAVTNLTPGDGDVDIENGDMLTWSWGANTQEYRVVLGTTYPPATVVQDWTMADTDVDGSYTLTDLNPNLQYFWRVDVRNNNGTSNGDVWGFTTTISSPTELAATVNDPGVSAATVSAELTWTGPTNRAFIGYDVYRDGVKITPTPIDNASFTDLGLARNTTYSYYVKSVYDEGESAASNTVSITTKGVGTADGVIYDFLTNDPIEGANVRIEGPEGIYTVITGADGVYSTLAYAGSYSITASATGYTNQIINGVAVSHGNIVSNDFYMMEVPLPVGEVTAFELSDDAVQISWDGSGPEPPQPVTMRYDDGVRLGQLGFTGGTTNSTIGAVHPINATLQELSWLLSDAPTGGGPHATVQLYLLGLTEDGTPDGANVLYTASVANVDGVWNTHVLPTPIEAPDGFYLAAAYNGFVGVGTDDGVDAPYEYVPGSHFYSFDYTGGAFTAFEPGFPVNCMLRAYGVENAVLSYVVSDEPQEKIDNGDINLVYNYPTFVPHPVWKTKSENSGTADRGIVDYTVWRETVYRPVALDVVGNTTQQNFVDFDWELMDWGVYRWAVTTNYEAGQVSTPVFSNTLDKNMEVMVDVAVSLNSAEAPGGTSVTFTNMSEPALELVYNTVLDNSGTFTWDEFRRGVYDIEVMLPGYGIVQEMGVEIFDDASFAWLLEEMLSSPSNLYVTPTAFATWELGDGGAPFVPMMESFDGLANGELPAGWTKSPDLENWGAYNSANAGGTAPEMRFNWSPSSTGVLYLMTPMMSTEGQAELQLSFKHFINDFSLGDPYTLSVIAIADGVEYIIEEWYDPASIPSTPESYTLTAAHGVGASDFQIAWVFDGYTYDINYWYIDDVMLNGSRAKAGRSFTTNKVFLDGQLVAETTDSEYQFDVATLTPYETYTAGVAAVYTTGQSPTTEKDFIYVPCGDYDEPTAFAAAQVEGTLDIMLEWTNVDAAALDTIMALAIYRNGEEYELIDFEDGAVSTFLDEDLEFGMYTYCVTYIYDSGAETCQGVTCSDEIEIDGNAGVDGMVMQAAYLGGDPIEGASVMLVNVDDPDIMFEFFTDATGAYEGMIIAGTYDYTVSAMGYTSVMLEDVEIVLNATVTNDFELIEFPYPPILVVAEEITDNNVLITWHNPMYAPFEPVMETFDAGIPASWTVVTGGNTADTWYMETPAGNPQTAGASLDGTNFAYVDSDEAGSSADLDEMLYSPVVNAATAEALYLTFDQYYRHLGTGTFGKVDVYDGTDWVTVLNQVATAGAWDAPDQQMIDVSMYANEEFQVRFHYYDATSWAWYWALDNVAITDEVTRSGAPVLSNTEAPERGLFGYEVWRTTCETGDLEFLGLTLDTLFNDNTWGTAEAGIYKWGVRAVYDEENYSEVIFSNCLDKDMVTTVSVTVTTNSTDGPEETDVMFTNTSEPELGLVYETELDETGFFAWDEFRKGVYDIYVNKNGFAPIEITDYLIDGPEAFVWLLEELLLPVSDLYVTPTGFATWREGGVIPFEPYAADFEADEMGWEIQGNVNGWQWGNTGSLSSTFMSFAGNSTNFIAVNADAAGSGGTPIVALTKSPMLDLSSADEVYVSFDYRLLNDDMSIHYSIGGGDPILLEQLAGNTAWTTNYMVMLPDEALASDVQILFLYEEGSTWGYGGAVDNVVVTDEPMTRELEYYKIWLDGVFVADVMENFYQYDVTDLVEGEEYYSEVAAVYSNGMSAKMDYTWIYYSCENYPGPENLAGSVSGMDVTLTWGASAPPPPPGGDFFEGFEAGTLPTGWVTYDEDGDSYIWDNTAVEFDVFEAHTGLYCMTSASYRNDVGALTPDNWLVTPAINVTAASELNFWVSAQDAAWSDEQYYVKVSTTGNAVADFTETVHTAVSPATWGEVTVDLSAYAGETIYIAFQHADVTDMFFIKLDDVTVTNTATRAAYTSPMAAGLSNEMPFKTLGMSQSEIDTRYDNLPAITRHDHSEMDANADARTVEMSREMWDLEFSFDIDTPSGLVGLAGAETDGEYIYATKWSASSDIVKFTMDGTYVETFQIPGVSSVRDLAFDGTYMYGAAASTTVFQMDFTNKTLIGTITAPTAVRAIAYDDVNDAFWGNNFATNMVLFDRSGATLSTIVGPPSMYGAAFDNFSEGGPYLWFFTGTSTGLGCQLEQYDIAAGALTGVSHSVSAELGDYIAGGLYISEDLVEDKVVIGGTAQGTPDLAFAFELIDNSGGGGGGGGGDFEPGPVAGVNVYRDGMLIAEMVQDTFYVDQDVDYGMYTYCVTYVYESGAESCSEACVDVELAFPCDAPKELVGEYLWTEEAWGSMIEWNSPQDAIAEWLYYDDGVNVDGIGGPATFTWAIKFDPAQLADYAGASLTKIDIYNRVAGSNELRIYEGTNAATLLHSQTLSGLGIETWEEVDLTDAVMIDVTKELWIAVNTTNGAAYPAGCGNYTGNPNSDLITLDGVLWEHLNDLALPYTWNLRGYVTTMAGATAALPIDTPVDSYSNAGETVAASGKPSYQTAGPASSSATADRELDVFNVYRSLGDDNYELISTVPFEEGVTAYSYYDTDVEAQVGYNYQVTAFYTYTNGTCESDPAMALVNPEDDFVYVFVTNTNEFSLNNTRVYPNPATNNVVIESAQMNRVTVMSALGQVVIDRAIEGQTRHDLNTSAYEAGVYLIRIETNEGVVTKRLTIVR